MFLLLLLAGSLSWASNEPLDPGYKNLIHPEYDLQLMDSDGSQPLPSKTDIHRMIRQHTPVRNQQNRGTCSIFSATALLESLLVIHGKATGEIDLSEEWLQYLTTLKVAEEGSTSPDNFELLRKWGQPSEAAMPYVGTAWRSKSRGLANKRCGHLPRGRDLTACLISHRDPNLIKMSDAELLNPVFHLYDPEFVSARAEALLNRGGFFSGPDQGGIVRRVSGIHQLLSAGIPLTLDLNFFNGAWNYPGIAKYGIYRSEKLWRKGVVTHPEAGSVDFKFSTREGEGQQEI
jgi:hypothetical protein